MSETEPEPARGCCTSCGGKGGTSIGPCTDCYGTGCAHPDPLCGPPLEEAARREAERDQRQAV